MNNYNLLTQYLLMNSQDEVLINFDDFQEEIGIKLPDFVEKNPSRFFYNDHSNSYYKYWRRAGYLAKPNKRKRTVLFVKIDITCQNNDDGIILKKRCNSRLLLKVKNLDVEEIERYII